MAESWSKVVGAFGVGGAAATTWVVHFEGSIVEASGAGDAHSDGALEWRLEEELVAKGLVVGHLLPCSTTHLRAVSRFNALVTSFHICVSSLSL